MASNQLIRTARAIEAARGGLAGLIQGTVAIEAFVAHELAAELAALDDAAVISPDGTGITAGRVRDAMRLFGHIQLSAFGVGDGQGNDALGNPPLSPADASALRAKLGV